MTRTEVVVAHTTAMLAQNNVILVQIQSHLGLPMISQSVLAQASSDHPLVDPIASTHPEPPAASLGLLAVVAVVDTPPASSVAPQPTQDEDDIPPAAHH